MPHQSILSSSIPFINKTGKYFRNSRSSNINFSEKSNLHFCFSSRSISNSRNEFYNKNYFNNKLNKQKRNLNQSLLFNFQQTRSVVHGYYAPVCPRPPPREYEAGELVNFNMNDQVEIKFI